MMKRQPAIHLSFVFWQYLFSCGLTAFLGRRYLAFVPVEAGAGVRVANLAALVSTCILLNLVAFLVAGLAAAGIRRTWFTLGVSPLLFAIVGIFVYTLRGPLSILQSLQ